MTKRPTPGNERALEQFMQTERIERFDRVLHQRTKSLTVVLDGVHNHHNISAVIRSADAFGLSSIHLIGEGFSYSKGVTLGTERWLEIVHHPDGETATSRLKEAGYTLVVTAPEDTPRKTSVQSMPVHALPFERPLAVIFGNERRGVSEALFNAAEIHAFIPMVGFVESLNISVACAITLYSSMISSPERTRQVPLLSAEERESLRAEWLVTGMKKSTLILREIERREEEDN